MPGVKIISQEKKILVILHEMTKKNYDGDQSIIKFLILLETELINRILFI